ncbi:MAG: asparagine--tRNA ligase [Gammaproteobacteria bacterium]|jgi:asparaginyl-tRNA synthetase|nr:asparagine--tRNA ligase [Gammaproteobacteria bacterium]
MAAFPGRVAVNELLSATSAHQGVTVAGWVRTKRESKDFAFVEVNDGSCLANLQVIVDGRTAGYEHLGEVGTGAAIAAQGDLVESPGKGQRWELRAASLRVVGHCDDDYPLQKKRHSDEFLRSIAHLRARTNKYGALARLRSRLSFATHQFFQRRGFHYVHTPIITGSDCEGAGEMFRVTTLDPYQAGARAQDDDFFGKEAHLTVSGQLSVETYCLALSKVYTFGPTFRAENSNTSRHMAEFWMIEPEIAFADIHDDMQLAEDMVRELVAFAREDCAQDLELFARFVDPALYARLDQVMQSEFVRLPYTEAIDILRASGRSFDYEPAWGRDLQSEHERFLTEEHFKGPVFVYDWPKEIKAFYMRANDDGRTVAAMDLLIPQVGELIGGSAREERLDLLKMRINELGFAEQDYWWYLDTRRFGSVPHAGFGLGFERFLMFVSGVSNIRDVIPFPRTPRHLEF